MTYLAAPVGAGVTAAAVALGGAFVTYKTCCLVKDYQDLGKQVAIIACAAILALGTAYVAGGVYVGMQGLLLANIGNVTASLQVISGGAVLML